MKTQINHLKEILHDNKDDLMFILFAGIPYFIFLLLVNGCIDYSHLF
jgi:hypothetical protein